MKTLMIYWFAISAVVLDVLARKDCISGKKSQSKLFCYYSNLDEVDGCYCSHVILPANSDVKSIERVRQQAKGVKIYVSVNEFNQGLINLLKSSKVDGLEINLKKLDSKNDISDFISTVKSKLGNDLDIALSVPSKAELVAKYFDFKALSKHTDYFILETAFLGASTNVTFHPSRLSGMWDLQNTDSAVDLISGLGAPLSKVVIAAPVQGFQFTLQNEEYTAPGSPAVELQSVTRDEICKMMNGGQNWTLERDEDQAGPYIFSKNKWIAFEDPKSMDIKAKYSRVRGLAGIALKDLSQDGGAKCGSNILEAAYNGLSRQARAPRGAVLHSLEREILESPTKPLESVQLSPYRISRIIDTQGKIHVIRQDSRTEFQCSRQGFFVHPRSCNRFYRCVKFDQLLDDFNVFEFDCPAGLAFDERVEVCVWPGSLPHGTPCSGSSEIAPVPRERFVCPSEPGYYADPENCRWFFACLDHGKSPLSAYEFRCPFGLVFDGERLVCEWPWLVPKCASGLGSGFDSEYYYRGGSVGAGYSGTGSVPPGVILQSYDGIGTLGAIKLGGISGKLEKPISTVYSNVGSGNLGLGYQNNGGYIVGGGLGYKAVQSLQDAGLLKVNNGVGLAQIYDNSFQGAGYSRQDLSSGLANIQYSSGYDGNGRQAEGGNAIGLEYSNNKGTDVSSLSYTPYAGQNGIHSGSAGLISTSGSLNGVPGLTSHYDAQYHGTEGAYQGSNVHLGQANVDQTRYISSEGATSGSGLQGAAIYSGQERDGSKNAISSQSITQYHGQGQRAGTIAIDLSKQNGDFGSTVGSGYQNGGYIAVGPPTDSEYYGQRHQPGTYTYDASAGQGLTGTVSGKTTAGYVVTGATADLGSAGIYNGKATARYNAEAEHGENVVDLSNTKVFGASDDKFNTQYVHNGAAVDDVRYQGVAQGNGEGAVSSQSFTQYYGNQDHVNGNTGTEADSSYEDNSKYLSGASGSVNIVGGGYSAVGTLSGVNVINNGDDLKTVSFSSTPTPSVSTYYPLPAVAPIPTVTSVPVPGIRTASGLETFQGGVVANIPQLQYKVQSHGDFGQRNHSSNFANVIFTTPATVTLRTGPQYTQKVVQTYSQDNGYVYNKPDIAFEETPINTISVSTPKPFVSVGTINPNLYVSSTVKPITVLQEKVQEGYVYQKPSVTFKEIPIEYATTRPGVAVKPQPAISSYNFQTYDTNGGYKYETPSVAIEDQPQGISLNTFYTAPKPAVIFKTKPQVFVSSTLATPVLSTYSSTNDVGHNDGYVYNKPTISLEETAVVKEVQPAVISKFSIRKPVIQQSSFTGGYYYEKPLVKFETNPIVVQPQVNVQSYEFSNPTIPKEVPTNIQQEKTVIENYAYHQPDQPAVISSYFIQKPSVQKQPMVEVYKHPELLSTYTYQPPVQETVYKAPLTSYTYQNVTQSAVGYTYPKPQIFFKEQPIQTYSYATPTVQPTVVSSYNYLSPSTPKPYGIVQPAIATGKKSTSYAYTKYFSGLEQKPIVVQSQVDFKGYDYPKPAVAFEEQAQQAVINSYNYFGSTAKPAVAFERDEHVYEKPTVTFKEIGQTIQPGAVKSYIESPTPQPEGYAEEKKIEYPKSTVNFVKTPVTYSTVKPPIALQPAFVTSYSYSTTPKPDVNEQNNVGYIYPKPHVKFDEKPAILTSSYSYDVPSTPKSIILDAKQEGYIYSKPSIKFEERPIQPAVETSYSYSGSTTQLPDIYIESQQPAQHPVVIPNFNYVVPPTPKPQLLEEQPAVVTSYFHQQPSKSVDFGGYDYPKPSVQFGQEPQVITAYEDKVPVQEVPFVKKTAYATGQHQHQSNVKNQQPGSVVVENYQFPDYEKVKQKLFGGITSTEIYQQEVYQPDIYQQPQVYVQSTPKPTFLSTIKTIAANNVHPVTPATVHVYDSRYSFTPEILVSTTSAPDINIVSTTRRPISKYSFSSLDDNYQYNQYLDLLKSPTPGPERTYLPVTSTVRINTLVPRVKQTKVVEAFIAPEVSSLNRDYLPVGEQKIPPRGYLPVEVTTPAKQYLPVRQRIVGTTAAPDVTTLFREYLPVKSRIRVTTTGIPLVQDKHQPVNYQTIPMKPSVIRVIQPKTIIKQNVGHPLLSAKLGAQCTCVSNTLRLRKKQKIIIVDDDENEDDDDYVVDNGNEGNVVESYQYQPQRVVEIMPTSEVYTKSTSSFGSLPKTYAVKKRIRVRPLIRTEGYYPVTDVSEVFIKKDTSSAIYVEDSSPSDQEVLKAVNTGLKLVKQAAKEGARQGTEEAINKFDRYGPGGVRSRTETLQGTIDCQRAGLFRHPTECNKFYACRWDCTKNRFTLHVFNCPVHLTFDNSLGACNWPSQGPACVENTLITSD